MALFSQINTPFPDFVSWETPEQIAATIMVVFFLLSVTATWLINRSYLSKIRNIVDDELGRERDARMEQLEEVHKIVAPRVTQCWEPKYVIQSAAEILSLAVATKANSQQKRKDSGDDVDNDESHFITFYGAANLGERKQVHEEYSDPTPAIDAFKEAMINVVASNIRVRRHVSLFDLTELEARSRNVQVEYLQWLCNQYAHLNQNEHYALFNNRRAPQWGSNIARLITHEAVLEITGDGESAFAIHDRDIARKIRGSARGAVKRARADNQIRFMQADPDKMRKLANEINEQISSLGLASEVDMISDHFAAETTK